MLHEDDGAFRTKDMALATVLSCQGFRYHLERISAKDALWVFEPPANREDEFDDLVDSYNNHACKVEPRSFVVEWGKVRTKLYAFLGISRRRADGPSSSRGN